MKKKTNCFSCGAICDSKEDYCHGCWKIVCVDCSIKYDHIGSGKHGMKRVTKKQAKKQTLDKTA